MFTINYKFADILSLTTPLDLAKGWANLSEAQ